MRRVALRKLMKGKSHLDKGERRRLKKNYVRRVNIEYARNSE